MENLTELELSLKHLEDDLRLYIFPHKENTLYSSEDFSENCEARYQFVEGAFYDYQFSNPEYHFGKNEIVKCHSNNKHLGTISPNIYVGTLKLPIYRNNQTINESVEFEVQSIKSNYRDEYRDMLSFITDKCAGLIMQADSPVSHHFETDYTIESETIYQKFAFVKSVLETNEFEESIHAIISSPTTKWSETLETKDISAVKRFKNSQIKELIMKPQSLILQEDSSLRKYGFNSLPSKIEDSIKIDIVDTPENRFVKHALEIFLKFCIDINSKADENLRLYKESLILINKLESYLACSLFKEVSRPSNLLLNSPVLQRKEGYKDILRVWLMFELAAKLVWNGGEDIYEGGKKDVAILYEYWLFFKLLELLESIFEMDPNDISDLIKPTKNGLNLQIKQGTCTQIKGLYTSGNRKLHVKFNYNRSFSGKKEYPASGSWTTTMRPDYTLSFWPYGIKESEAEIQELIVHIHFDAKYKISNKDIDEILNQKITGEPDLNYEKNEDLKRKYKNVDLIKMHAYKDAIRRTGGSYILYPGDEQFIRREFHEIIPGLGAFPVKPSNTDDGINDLRLYIQNILQHITNRANQRENLTYRIYDIHKEKSEKELNQTIPEKYNSLRIKPPAEIFVVVGDVDENHKNWILNRGFYNYWTDKEITPEMIGAEYLLLYDNKSYTPWVNGLFEIISKPEIKSAEWIKEKGYEFVNRDIYFVYKIKTKVADWSLDAIPVTENLYEFKKNNPITISLVDLLGNKP